MGEFLASSLGLLFMLGFAVFASLVGVVAYFMGDGRHTPSPLNVTTRRGSGADAETTAVLVQHVREGIAELSVAAREPFPLAVERRDGSGRRSELPPDAPHPEEVITGDAVFDDLARISGDPVAVAALVTPKVRAELALLLETGVVHQDLIEHVYRHATRQEVDLVQIEERLRWLHSELSAPRTSYVARLVRNVRLDPSPAARIRCLRALASPEARAPRETVSTVARKALADSDHRVALAAAGVLPSGDEEVANALLARLRAAPSLEGAQDLFRVLLETAPPSQRDEAINLVLATELGELKLTALEFIAEQKLPGWGPKLTRTAVPVEVTQAVSFAKALAACADRSATPALLELLNHEETSVRRAAAVALGKVGSLDAVEALHPIAHALLVNPWLKGAARDAINAIQSRQGSAEAGRLTLAEDRSAEGGLSLTEDHQTDEEADFDASPRRSQS
jgi:hypothetical protein